MYSLQPAVCGLTGLNTEASISQSPLLSSAHSLSPERTECATAHCFSTVSLMNVTVECATAHCFMLQHSEFDECDCFVF